MYTCIKQSQHKFYRMKKAILLLAFFSFNLMLAQTSSDKVIITLGDEEKESRYITLEDVIGYDETGIYVLKRDRKRFKNTKYYLAKYDYEMNPIMSEEIEKPRKNQFLEYFTNLNDQLQIFSSHSDKEKFINSFYIDEIDKSSLKFKGDEKTLAKINFEGGKKANSGNFTMRISPDSSKVLLFLNKPYEKKENESFDLVAYDKDWNLIWENQVTLPYPDKKFSFDDIKIDNSGNVHIVGTKFFEKSQVEKGKPGYAYHVLSYYSKGKELKDLEIKLGDKFISHIQTAISDNNELICGGFYSEYKTGIKGSYFMKFNLENQSVISNSFDEFSTNFITQNLSEKQIKKVEKKEKKGKEPSLFKYYLDDIIFDQEGGAYLIGEQFYIRERVTTRTQNGITTTSTTYIYYYNDIIVIRMDANGKISWSKKIPKKQRTSNDSGFFSSYVLSLVDDKMYFVFNDNPKNLYATEKSSGIFYFTGRKESLVTMVEMDQNGNQTREALFSTRDAEILIRPKVSEQISERKLVLYGQKKKTHKFILLDFK